MTCQCPLALPHGAMVCSTVCNSGIVRSYSLVFSIFKNTKGRSNVYNADVIISEPQR